MESSSNDHNSPTTQQSQPARAEASAEGDLRPVHGAITPAELRRLGLDPEQVLDFSASISPLGPPQGVWDAIQQADLTVYPDPECLDLREALAHRLSLPTEQVLVGNGSTELIHLLARAFLSPHPSGAARGIFLLTPTYGEYSSAGRMVGAEVSSQAAYYSGGFCWDFPAARDRIITESPGLVFICNPNNPTGVYLSEPDVHSLLEATTSAGGLLVLDEAYINFVDQPWDSLALLGRGNVALLRSMTKDYALTGLRLGYSLASPEVTARLASFQPYWSVNALAQAAGKAALADQEYLPRARKAVAQARDFLDQGLSSLGFTVLPSSANFLLVQVGNGTIMRERLIRRGIVVRDCSSFGLPDSIRIGIRSLPDCERLLGVMEDLA